MEMEEKYDPDKKFQFKLVGIYRRDTFLYQCGDLAPCSKNRKI